MRKRKTGRFQRFVSIVLILGVLSLSGCGSGGGHQLRSDFSTPGTGGETSPDARPETSAETQDAQAVAQAGNAAPVAGSIENIYGSWYINHANATLWFNDLSYEYAVPSSDFTVENFDLETLQPAQGKDNRTYYLENDLIEFDTFSGDILSFSYQFYSDGSLVLTSADTGQAITLTREMGTGGQTITETIGGHKYGSRMGNIGWGASYPVFGSVLAWEGGTVCFISPADNRLYRCNEDGTGQTLMADMYASDVNIMDGWVYFSGYDEADRANTTGVYKMKLDGTQLSKLFTAQSPNSLKVMDDKLYYMTLSTKGNTFCCADLDGKNSRVIANLESYGNAGLEAVVYGDYAYFTYDTKKGATILYATLARVSLSDGTTQTLVPKLSSDRFFIDQDGIFTVFGNDIYHYDLNGGGEVKLVDCFTEYVIKIGTDLIYSTGINAKGTEMADLSDLRNPTTVLNFTGKVCCTDKYLFYYSGGAVKASAYR